MLTIVHANLYAGNRQLETDWKKHIGPVYPHSVGVNEAMRHVDFLTDRRRYTYMTGDPTLKDRNYRRGALDCGLLMRKDMKNLGDFAFQISETVQPVRIAPERWLVAGCYFAFGYGTVAHVVVHNNAAVRNPETNTIRPTRVPRVREWRQGMARTELFIMFLKSIGYRNIVLTGDLNLPKSVESFDQHPDEVFKRLGMNYRNVGLDYVAWTKRMDLESWEEIPAALTGADHPWLVAEFS